DLPGRLFFCLHSWQNGRVKSRLNVGLIGYQGMGKAHSNAYRQVGHFFDQPYDLSMDALCGRTQTAVEEAAEHLGWNKVSLDWREVVRNPEIDIVDIATPGDSHCEIAVEAA